MIISPRGRRAGRIEAVAAAHSLRDERPGCCPTQAHQVREDRGERWAIILPHGDQRFYADAGASMAQRGDAGAVGWMARAISGRSRATRRFHAIHRGGLARGAVLMEDMDKDTVDFVPIMTRARPSPSVFPAAFRSAGQRARASRGHGDQYSAAQLGEVIDGICARSKTPTFPSTSSWRGQRADFPTGCMVSGGGHRDYFATGRGI